MQRSSAITLLLLCLEVAAGKSTHKKCGQVPYPFSLKAKSAAGPEFHVKCLKNGKWYLPSLDINITGFGQGYITTDKPMFSRACGNKTNVEVILDLPPSFSLSSANILAVNGTLARGLVADSFQNMFPYQSSSQPIGMEFFDEVTLAGWGDCGGAYLKGPEGACWWDGSPAAPQGGSCDVQIDYNLPTTVACPDVPYPFSYNDSTAAGPEFVVVCLSDGKVNLPSIDVNITSFGQDYITTDKPMFSRACQGATHVTHILNLTPSFSLSAVNILDVNGTQAEGLVADSNQNMFPYQDSPQPLGMTFYNDVTLEGWGKCGGAYMRGPTGQCWWDGSPAAPQGGSCDVQIDYSLPTVVCPDVPYPFSYNGSTAAGPEFVVVCLSDGKVNLPSIDVNITSFGQGFITTDKPMFSRACKGSTHVTHILNLTPSFSLSAVNILDVNGTQAEGLVADSIQNMFPYQDSPQPLGMTFYNDVTLEGWGKCGGSYLRGPTGQCWWDGSPAAPQGGSCDVQIDYTLSTPVVCPDVPYPFSYNDSTAAGSEFVVVCLSDGTVNLPSIDINITSFGQSFITTDRPMYSRACQGATHVTHILNLTPSFSLSAVNILDVNGTQAEGLVADSNQNMFPYQDSPQPLGMTFYNDVTLEGWGKCGGAYMRGPTGQCWWDGSPAAPQGGSCEVQIDYSLPTVACPDVPYPFSYNDSTAAGPEFVVVCLSDGKVNLPSIDVNITSFGQGYITTDKPMFSRACQGATHVTHILNLTPSFSLSAVNILDVNGTQAEGLVADSNQNMFPYQDSPQPLGMTFTGDVTLEGWGNCGGAYLRGPDSSCWWNGSQQPPFGSCNVQIDYQLPNGRRSRRLLRL